MTEKRYAPTQYAMSGKYDPAARADVHHRVNPRVEGRAMCRASIILDTTRVTTSINGKHYCGKCRQMDEGTTFEDDPIYNAIDIGGGQTCDIAGVIRELHAHGYIIAKQTDATPETVAAWRELLAKIE